MTTLEPLVRQDLEDEVVRLSLSAGAGNPISPALVAAFEQHLADLEVDAPRALVLDGGPGKLFSGGFDLKTVLDFSQRQMRGFFRDFCETVARLVELPAPTFAAVHGHAIAGGFILPLACDFRVVQSGPLKLGLGEVDLGIPVPAGTLVLLGARTTPATAARLSMFATMMTPEEAADAGYADVVAADAQAEAVVLARTLANKPGAGVRVTKQILARQLAQQMREADQRWLDRFMEAWFADEAQDKLRALTERL